MIGVAFEVLRGAGLQGCAQIGEAGRIHDGVDVHVSGNVLREFGPAAAEQVDHSTGQIAGGEDFRKRERGQRMALGSEDHGGIAAEDHGGEQRNQRDEHRLVWRENDDHTGGFGRREIKMRGGNRVHAAEDLGVFVRTASEINQAIDGQGDFGAGASGTRVGGANNVPGEFLGAALQHLSGTVENLAAQVRGLFGPSPTGGPRGSDGIAEILARGRGIIVEQLPGRRSGRETASAFAADEISANVQLVGFPDFEMFAHGAAPMKSNSSHSRPEKSGQRQRTKVRMATSRDLRQNELGRFCCPKSSKPMNARELIKLGVPPGEAVRRATDFVARFILGGGDKGRLEEEVRAVVANPGAFIGDSLRGEFARALQSAPPAPRTEPVPYRQWGEKLEPDAVSQMENACLLPVAVAGALMPDAHVGYGLPIGGVLATENAVVPYAVGVDIACRMKLTVLDIPARDLEGRQDRLTRAIEAETRFGVGAMFKQRRHHDVLDADWSVS